MIRILTRCKLSERGVSDTPLASCFTCTSLHNAKLTTKTSFNFVELFCEHSEKKIYALKMNCFDFHHIAKNILNISILVDESNAITSPSIFCLKHVVQATILPIEKHSLTPAIFFLLKNTFFGFFVRLIFVFRWRLIANHRSLQLREFFIVIYKTPEQMLLFVHKNKFSHFFFSLSRR